MEPKPTFAVGQQVTVADRADRPLRFLEVTAVKKRPRVLILSDGTEWEWDGWRPRGSREFYMGPIVRARDPEDEQRKLRDEAVQAICRARAEDLERLPTELLAQVAAALAAEPENPDVD